MRTGYFGGGGGSGGGLVTSVFGRIGAIAATLGDYVASLVGNDSDVPGITVANALNNVKDIPSLDVATTGNVALTGTPANIDTGVTLVNGVTSILVWLNTDPKENGPWLYNSGGAWTRLPGWTTAVAFRPAQPFQIAGGDHFGGRTAYLKNATSPVIGTSNIIFNVDLEITPPTALGQTLVYNPATNKLEPTGPLSEQLTDASSTIAVTTAFNWILSIPITASRTKTLDNTGATLFDVISFDIRVALAFPFVINNALGLLYTFPAGFKGIGAFQFSGGQWGGPTGIQKAS